MHAIRITINGALLYINIRAVTHFKITIIVSIFVTFFLLENQSLCTASLCNTLAV